MRKGICDNITNCDLADNNDTQEIADTGEFVCGECGKDLKKLSGGGGKVNIPPSLYRIGGLLLLGLLAFFIFKDGCGEYSPENICIQMNNRHMIVLEKELEDDTYLGYPYKIVTDSIFCACMIACENIEVDSVCGTDGEKYRNAACLGCNTSIAKVDCPTKTDPDGGVVLEFDEQKAKDQVQYMLESFYFDLAKLFQAKSPERREELKASMLRKFIDNQVRVEVSNKGIISTYSIGQYIDHVDSLGYNKIEITIDEMTISSFKNDFTQEIVRKKAKARVEQVFKGEQLKNGENEIVYADRTTKEIDVFSIREKTSELGEDKMIWKTYLSTISIIERDKPILN